MNYALIDNQNTVANIIEWDGVSPWRPPIGYTALPASDEVAIGWTVVRGQFTPPPPKPPLPPTPNYVAFWNALLASTVYGSIRTQSMTSLPMNTLVTEFIALIGDAKVGHPNEAAIQTSINAVFSAGTFTEDDAQELTVALAIGHLDTIYTIGGLA